VLKNSETHKDCFCHKDSEEPAILLQEYPEATRLTVNVLQRQILFMIRGEGRITIENTNVDRILKKEEFIFLPAGARLVCDCLKNTMILSVRIVVDHPQCHALKIQNTTRHRDDGSSGIYALKVNKQMRQFVKDMLGMLDNGFQCRLHMQTEASRMLFLLHGYYSQQECVDFFSHIQTPDIKFSEFVRKNHTKYKTIGEMADAVFMTSQSFSKRFKKVFGMPPHRWMQQEKARSIYEDICKNELSLKEIAIKYEFPLSSHFFRFCKQTFGESPGNIRKGITGDAPRPGE
jgi:AraC-like DNA-binding protein